MVVNHHDIECRQLDRILARVGDRWSMRIVRLLGDGSHRFNEIRRTLDGISQRMLTLTVRGLERDGLVTRTVYPSVPPRVDYALTDLGRSLWQAAVPLLVWAQENRPLIEEANRSFDRSHTPAHASQHAGAQP